MPAHVAVCTGTHGIALAVARLYIKPNESRKHHRSRPALGPSVRANLIRPIGDPACSDPKGLPQRVKAPQTRVWPRRTDREEPTVCPQRKLEIY